MPLPNPDLEFTPYNPLSAGELNDIVENVESLAGGTGFNDDAVPAQAINFGGSGAGIWWEEIGRTTLTVAGDTVTVNDLPARKYLQIHISLLPSGAITGSMRFNNDSGSNYAFNSLTNGGAGAGSTSQTFLSVDVDAATTSKYAVVDCVNIQSSPKLTFCEVNSEAASGAGTAPNHRAVIGKWQNTSAQITRVDVLNTAGGDFAIGTQVVVLGHD
jgi:hypothetical protein